MQGLCAVPCVGAGGVVMVEHGSSLCHDVQIVAAVIYLWFAGFSFCLASASFPVCLSCLTQIPVSLFKTLLITS